MGAIVIAIAECLHSTALMPLVAGLAPPALRGRNMAAIGLSWWIGLALAPALGTSCSPPPRARRSQSPRPPLVTAVYAMTLERQLPKASRLTPRPVQSRFPPRTRDSAGLRHPAWMTTGLATHAGSFALGGELPVTRLGYGTMQLPGPGVWGPPRDHDEAIRVLRRAVELGVTLLDTADSYGPAVAEPLIKEALYPYPDDLVIATKAGFTRQGPGKWVPLGRPEYLKQQVELSLRFLGLETIDLLQLHRIDAKVPVAESLGALVELQQEGKIRFIGLSEVSVEQLEEARRTAEIVSVQNLYNLADRSAERLLEHAQAEGIAFIPWFPLATGRLVEPGGPLGSLAGELGATPAQLALAWLLRRSPVMLPIPGTASLDHLEENLEVIELSDEQFDRLTAAT